MIYACFFKSVLRGLLDLSKAWRRRATLDSKDRMRIHCSRTKPYQRRLLEKTRFSCFDLTLTLVHRHEHICECCWVSSSTKQIFAKNTYRCPFVAISFSTTSSMRVDREKTNVRQPSCLSSSETRNCNLPTALTTLVWENPGDNTALRCVCLHDHARCCASSDASGVKSSVPSESTTQSSPSVSSFCNAWNTKHA